MDTIKNSGEIEKIFKEGRRVKTPFFLLLVQKTPPQRDQNGRVAYIAGKKLGNAPFRSRCKRLLREMVRVGGYTWAKNDVVFVARAHITKTTPLYLQTEYLRALKQADLLEATALS